MKLYIDAENIIHALEDDGSQDFLIQPGWTAATEAEADLIRFPVPTLKKKKTDQLAVLAAGFSTFSAANVTDDNGVIWSGGMSSALSIYGAVQLAAVSDATSVTLFDAGNLPHAVTIEQGTAVAATIGAAYQTVFAKYQSYKVAVAAATTVTEVQAIAWS